MKLINPSVEILTDIPDNVIQFIERVGRVCYKSEDKITLLSAKDFVRNLIKRGHESVLEHYSITVRFITDRGISHEIVRHRIASFSQESTRYCNYKDKDIVFTCPYKKGTTHRHLFELAIVESGQKYKQLLINGDTPQMARSVLPNALKTEIIMSANLREWRHFLRLRCSQAAHPQMRQIAIPLLAYLQKKIPVVFADIQDWMPEGFPLAKVTEAKFI